ncbi:GIY-YIG nuclease family protein [Carboxylicivirga caseinilyticus]|nr:GIY-YIG nuclease family protein [Marinilabiliaceae bacterium A049]
MYSEKFDRFYIGQTQNLKLRIEQHNSNQNQILDLSINFALNDYLAFLDC